mgnify:CR=1 FL=1
MKSLYKALADFQQEVPVILKDTQGYGYSYSDLPAIFKVINPLMKKYGLGFTQMVDENIITTRVFHCESEEFITSRTAIPQNVQLKGMNDFQVLGSAITYLRRYALSSMLGLVTDKDTDASGEQIKSGTVAPKEKPISAYESAVNALNTCISKESRDELLAKMLKSTKLNAVEKVQIQDFKTELDSNDLAVVNID